MRFYYGADKLLIEPLFNHGNPTNDYGLGFYMTKDKEMARLWASKNEGGGYLIEYDVDMSDLNILYLNNNTDDDVLKWISILVNHRFSKEELEQHQSVIKWLDEHYHISIEEYDMIVGYRADDSYFDYSRDFVNNSLSLEKLKEAMLLGKLGLQYVLVSKKSFKHIKYVASQRVEAMDEYKLFRAKTKNDYYKIKEEDDINNTYIRDIMRKVK